MASEVPFTIVKANGLDDSEETKEILVGHDDEGWDPLDPSVAYISRGNVARLLSYAAANPGATKGLRFDVTSKKGPGTEDIAAVVDAARLAWDPLKEGARAVKI